MAQCKVTSYYATRKRVYESKILKESSKSETISNTSDKLKFQDDHVKCEIQVETVVSDKKIKKGSAGPASVAGERKAENVTKKSEAKTKKAKPKTNPRTGKGRLKGKSLEDEGNSDIRKIFQTQKEKNSVIKQENEEETVVPKEENNEVAEVLPGKLVDDTTNVKCTETPCVTKNVPATSEQTLMGQNQKSEETSSKAEGEVTNRQSGQLSSAAAIPRRNLKDSEFAVLSNERKSASEDINQNLRSPQKKQHLEQLDPAESGSPQKKAKTMLASSISPEKRSLVLGRSHRQLELPSQSPTKLSSPAQQDSKVTLTNLERLKFLNSGRLDTLKERLSKFEKSLSTLKEAENNKYKITSVITPSGRNSSQVEAKPTDIHRTTPAAYERFHTLATAGAPSLTLPYKYKWLSEVFRCADTVVSMLHNRKEICSFLKLKNSVQEMTKRNFTKNHLGQIKTVFPLAYVYSQEKFHSSSIINPKPGVSQYQLVITPNLKTYREKSSDIINENVVMQDQKSKANKNQSRNNVNKDSSHEQTSTPNSFVQMNPTILIERKQIFDSYLLQIVKKHHQAFLSRLNPPITVPFEKLSRWHSKFPLDTVPDIEPSPLPEPIDVPKCQTAMDVLNKIKGTVSDKVEKALQSVAEKSSSSTATDKSKVDTKGIIKSGIFKGISSDLLQRIRAREASKMVQEMIMPPEEKKKQQMMERLPEMVRIIRNYFISARKAAISMEDATQKVMDSYHSSLPQEDVRAHIQLLAEIFPKWLVLVSISKGVFLKIDKNMDINVMIDSITKT